ncbi:MAG: DNA mismatch repair endonuclease MutH [Gammaproteobacteria bacterium]|nr:DNA mismatch repair endonuclease MutH [Gammaproteobacteria bacterium]
MIIAPTSEAELLSRARSLVGLSLGGVANALFIANPGAPAQAKGWIGELMERALGADAGSRPEPDFTRIGVELKTIPITANGKPNESTYVCVAPAVVSPEQTWETSVVFRKLQRVLWVPVEAEGEIVQRRIGWPFLWTPNALESATLRADWEEIIELIATGRREALSARLGTYLQIRPKAANSRSRTQAANAAGVPEATLPRGFYLRATFTEMVLAAGMLD